METISRFCAVEVRSDYGD